MNTKVYFCSDTHFSHYNLIRGTSSWENSIGCRDFDNVEDHDNLILENLNSVIMPDDTLYHLGDFTVGSMPKFTKEDAYYHFRNRIKCRNIVYIRGNHSLKLDFLKEMNIFSSVHDYYELKYGNKFIVMSHYSFRTWNHMSKGSFMCFGHSHTQNYKDSMYGRSMDIGVDGNDFKPWLLDDVIEILKLQNTLKEGHHV